MRHTVHVTSCRLNFRKIMLKQSYLMHTVKVKTLWEGHKFKKISSLFWQNSCFHSIVSKQVLDFSKFFLDFSENLDFKEWFCLNETFSRLITSSTPNIINHIYIYVPHQENPRISLRKIDYLSISCYRSTATFLVGFFSFCMCP